MSTSASPGPDPSVPDPSALAAELAALGLDARIEADGRLAVLHAAEESVARLADGALRADVTTAARRSGFTHCAVALA